MPSGSRSRATSGRTGPRERHGVVVSLAAEPYETGACFPHERTHPRIRGRRLRLLRATRVQPEPILLLADARLDARASRGTPEISRWTARGSGVPPRAGRLGDGQLLIADGHHRYESALELAASSATVVRIMALVVSKDDPGLHVFPTHRVFSVAPICECGRWRLSRISTRRSRSSAASRTRAAAVAYRRGGVELVRGRRRARHRARRPLRTRRDPLHAALDEARRRRGRGAADVGVPPPRAEVEDVFAVARRGERMPPKSTYFFPKPLSGLLFHPLDP